MFKRKSRKTVLRLKLTTLWINLSFAVLKLSVFLAKTLPEMWPAILEWLGL